MRWKSGDVQAARPIGAPRPDVERFWAKVTKTPTCWLWTGALNPAGYGVFNPDGGTQLAHRWLYEQDVALVPAALQLDHTCLVTACVRPDHLDPVTHKENQRRARVARRA